MFKEKISFSVQMTVKEVYRFTMHHVYHRLSGVFACSISLAAFITLLVAFETLTEQSRAILIMLSIWLIFVEPVVLYIRSRGQVKRNKTYRQPLNYEIDKQGITVSQGEIEQTIAWGNLLQIIETKTQYLVYSSKINAFIFPKDAIGEECSAFEQMVLLYTKDTNVKLKGAIKKHKSLEKEG